MALKFCYAVKTNVQTNMLSANYISLARGSSRLFYSPTSELLIKSGTRRQQNFVMLSTQTQGQICCKSNLTRMRVISRFSVVQTPKEYQISKGDFNSVEMYRSIFDRFLSFMLLFIYPNKLYIKSNLQVRLVVEHHYHHPGAASGVPRSYDFRCP